MFHGEYSSEHFDEAKTYRPITTGDVLFGAEVLGLIDGRYPQSFLDLSQPVLTPFLSSNGCRFNFSRFNDDNYLC